MFTRVISFFSDLNSLFRLSLIQKFLLVAAVLVGVALRLENLFTLDVWFDEAYTVFSMQRPVELTDVHPPLYFFLLKIFSFFSGGGLFASRLFSLFFGILILPLGYLVIKQATDDEIVPLAGLWVLALSPLLIDYSIEARNYSLYILIAIGLVYCYNRARVTPFGISRWWVGSSICLAAGLLSHYFFIFFATIMGLIVLRDRLRVLMASGSTLKSEITKLIAFFAPVFIVFVVTFLPAIKLLGNNSHNWVPDSSLFNYLRTLGGFLFGVKSHGLGNTTTYQFWLQDSVFAGEWALIFLAIALLGFGLTYNKSNQNFRDLFYYGFGGLALIFLVGNLLDAKIALVRYHIAIGVFVILFLTALFNFTPKKIRALAPMILIPWWFFGINNSNYDRGYAAVSDFIAEKAPEQIFTNDDFEYLSQKVSLANKYDENKLFLMVKENRHKFFTTKHRLLNPQDIKLLRDLTPKTMLLTTGKIKDQFGDNIDYDSYKNKKELSPYTIFWND